ncbi:unnamed protein product [Adineta steineri]|uniref:Protein kinase domain-containing protein n=1 Tax=Adineta steineri TaxID=433720 RepID=A0A814QSU0_9BILA|nr:unnamed protein product [Adineta steineri]CAF3908967.1 unnamed protein product [Adineta steineri]
MTFITYFLLLFLPIVQLTISNTWSTTSTNCVWHEYTANKHLSKRIDLRDIRNQLLTVALDNETYYFNPCKTFNLPINDDPYTVNGEQCHNVLGCKKIQLRQDYYEYYTNAIKLNSTVLSTITPLTLQYYGSKSYANKKMHVRCDCNRRIHRAHFKFVEYQHNITPVFSLTHRCCCPNVCGGNTFPKGLLLILLLVILFIIGTAVCIFFQCRRHYPERNTYGAVATTNLNINTLEPSQGVKIGLTDNYHRSGTHKRPRSKSIVPVLENSIISSQDFKVIKRLGVGELGGEVCEGRWNEKLIAVKTLRIGVHPEKFSQTEKTYLENEIGLLSHVRHKNLTAVIGICFDIDIYPRILLSFAEHGTIIDFIRRFPTKVDWSLRLSWCINTSDALAYLHQSKILHRNLKSSNLLIGVDLRVHVCDYGLIPILQPLREACDSERCLCKLSHPALPVSIRWSSPEILSNPSDNSRFNTSCDVYSFGVCLWEQIRLEQPYADIKDEAEVSRIIVEGQRLVSFEETMTNVMPEYNDIMNACWAENPINRPTFERIGQLLRDALPKVKQFQKATMKQRRSSITNTTDIQEEHSSLFRLDSRMSTDTPKPYHPNV